MTDKLNYYVVRNLLHDICDKNNVIVAIKLPSSFIGHRLYEFHFDAAYIDHSYIGINANECDLTLYGFIEAVKKHFDRMHLTKNNFDWSYYMKKAFTKADLKNGDVIRRRNGDVEIVCVETDTCIVNGRSYNNLSDIKNDLTYGLGYSECDIVAVRRPKNPSDCCFNAFDDGYGELVYERSEPVEMTLEEVCEALGKDIKIVKR